MAEFEVRSASHAVTVRVIADDELAALNEASSLLELEDGEELTIYNAFGIPVGADSEDPE